MSTESNRNLIKFNSQLGGISTGWCEVCFCIYSTIKFASAITITSSEHNPKFSDEVELSFQRYEDNKSLLDASLSLNKMVNKDNVWRAIIAQVKCLGVAKRDLKDIRSRLRNAKLSVN